MTRPLASVLAAMLGLGIAACHSPPDTTALEREIRNRDETIVAQQGRIDQLTDSNAYLARRIGELEAASAGTVAKADARVQQLVARFQNDADIKVEAVPGGYRFVIRQGVLFKDAAEVELADGGRSALARVAVELNADAGPVLVADHAADLPATANAALAVSVERSVERALAVRETLITAGKVPTSRLSVAGYGPNRPREPNTTEMRRRQNRRVEIVVTVR